MIKFEIGKRYSERACVAYEVVARTEKKLTYMQILHAGKENERKSEKKTAKINIWDDREVLLINSDTIKA